MKVRVVARGDLEKRRIKKTRVAHQQHVLQLRQDIPMFNRLAYLNLLKTPGPPVHLQEGSNSSSPPLVQHATLLKVLTSLVPTFKPKSLAATL